MNKESKLEEMENHLDEVSEYRSFNIRYNNTDPNRAFHKAFIDFCWAEVDGNYLQGIKKLLENYSADYRFDALYSSIEDLKSSIIELQEVGVVKEKEEEKKGAF